MAQNSKPADNEALPTNFLLMRREILAIELRFLEDELIKRKAIKRPLVMKARQRDG